MKNIFEDWRDIPGFEGLYQVSNLGNVRALNYHYSGKVKNLKQFDRGIGYLVVHLCKNGLQKYYYVHRLVGQAFIENPFNFNEINHINENKQDNRVENLEWCSRDQNVRYSKAKRVKCYKNNKLIKEYEAIRDVIKDGFSQSAVSNCCLGKRMTHKGYSWSF